MIYAEDERRSEMSAEAKGGDPRESWAGAVKYADLSHNLTSDYVFDWDTMLASGWQHGALYAVCLCPECSIGRRRRRVRALPADLPLVLEHESEIALAKELLRFSHVLQQVSADLRPHLLTDYLYGLSRAFSTFYDRDAGVRIIDAEPESVRLSRLRLCDLTARVIIWAPISSASRCWSRCSGGPSGKTRCPFPGSGVPPS